MNDYRGYETTYTTVMVDNHEYQVPTVIARHMETLADTLEDEREKSAKTINKLSIKVSKEREKIAERIILNLNAGLPPMTARYSVPKFEKERRCLAFGIDHYEHCDTFGEPQFEFKSEVRRRILLALNGQTADGKDYK